MTSFEMAKETIRSCCYFMPLTRKIDSVTTNAMLLISKMRNRMTMMISLKTMFFFFFYEGENAVVQSPIPRTVP